MEQVRGGCRDSWHLFCLGGKLTTDHKEGQTVSTEDSASEAVFRQLRGFICLSNSIIFYVFEKGWFLFGTYLFSKIQTKRFTDFDPFQQVYFKYLNEKKYRISPKTKQCVCTLGGDIITWSSDKMYRLIDMHTEFSVT